jgi:hypothetical protein
MSSKSQVIDLKRLLSIVQNLDFKSINQHEPILPILQRLFPHIPTEDLTKIEQSSTALVEKQAKTSDLSAPYFFYLKVSLAIAATVTGLYFGGPVVAGAANAALTQIYSLLFGMPDTSSMFYNFLFKPCQKLLNSFAMTYGPYIVGLTAGPTTYSSLSIGEFLCTKVASLKSWAFDSQIKVEATAYYSLLSVDDIVTEFEQMAIEGSDNEIVIDDDFVVICPGFDQYQQSKPKEIVYDSKPTTTQSLKSK